MTPFLQSPGGRVVLVAAAVFLGTTGWYTISHNLYALGIGMPLGITLSFVGVGLALPDYLGESLFAVTVLPCALWSLIYATGEATFRHQPWLGYLLVLLAVLSLGRAAMGSPSSPATT
jgi:ABC-type transport system involved in cytochrome c biogenesis permease component